MKLLAAVVIVLAGLGASARTQAGEPTTVPVRVSDPAGVATSATASRAGTVSDALRALAVLHSYGYVWTTDAGALKALKHWQRVNGLEVDGIVGKFTLASLGLDAATASVPAVRQSPSPPAPTFTDPEQIIRDVWQGESPDVVNEAVRIAKRESSLVPTAANFCCYGLFQMHFRAHRAWLADYGVTKPADLFDPRLNATVALALYHASGWGPWKL